jgi:hypothetical protein
MNSPLSFPPLYFVKRGNTLKNTALPPHYGAESGLGVSSLVLAERGVKDHGASQRLIDKTIINIIKTSNRFFYLADNYF